MIHTVLVVTIDSQLGRLDPMLLSQQSRMEIFFDGVENKNSFTDINDNYIEVEYWKGILFNGDGDVAVLDFDLEHEFDENKLSGTLNFAYLPEAVTQMIFVHNHLEGNLDAKDLPKNLEVLSVTMNSFSGTVNSESSANSYSF